MQFIVYCKWGVCLSYSEDAFHDLGECLIIKSMEMEGILFINNMTKYHMQFMLFIEDVLKIEVASTAQIARKHINTEHGMSQMTLLNDFCSLGVYFQQLEYFPDLSRAPCIRIGSEGTLSSRQGSIWDSCGREQQRE